MALRTHAARIGLLLAFTTALLLWLSRHTEVMFADGLRYVHQAERIEAGQFQEGLLHSVDHPVYPTAIAGIHRLLGGSGPRSWQVAAQTTALLAGVLLIVPVYLLGLELFGPSAAWLGALLIALNHLTGFVVVNVLSESTFLLFWTWGLWGALRFLRDGRFAWLPFTLGFAALAYLTRPEGLLLPLSLVATLVTMPLPRSTRLVWGRWWAAIGLILGGVLLVVLPFALVKGGLGTKPAVARLLGTAPPSGAIALERDRPIAADETTVVKYERAFGRMTKVVRAAVTTPLLPFAALGLIVLWPLAEGRSARVWLFLGILLAASFLGLMRLHVTGGYCTSRHAMIPSMILLLAAAHGLSWGMEQLVVPGRWLGLPDGPYRAGPIVRTVVLVLLVARPAFTATTSFQDSFGAYHDAAEWISSHGQSDEKILDMTNWSLYFSERQGYVFADVYQAASDPATRWVVARKPHVDGRWYYSGILRELIENHEPVATFPRSAAADQVQILIFDRKDGTSIAGSPVEKRR